MSIKSEKAKEYLSQVGKDHFGIHPSSTAYYPNQVRKAVELAESDARERAVRAFCDSCTFVNGEECSHRHGCECDYVEIFIEHYDNQ